MENIFRIIYDVSIRNKHLSINDLDKIIEIIIGKKELKEYVLGIDVQQIRSNNIASYSINRKVTIYSNVLDAMISNLEAKILIAPGITKNVYINLCILQVVLHEIEHANQEKIKTEQSLEAFILRIAELVQVSKRIYEYNPEERFAEIKSYQDIFEIIRSYEKNVYLHDLLKNDELCRKISAYHFANGCVVSPIVSYFKLGEEPEILSCFEWYSSSDIVNMPFLHQTYGKEERLFYGFPISQDEYYYDMHRLLDDINNNFADRINILEK